MAKKGSKRNPYWGSEYINIWETSEWPGGWVLYEATNLKCYITQHHTEYRERDGEILGGEFRPYTYAVYDEMKGLEIWEGGWVLPNPNNPDSRGTTYHTVGDEIYGVVNLIPLGEEENPFPIDVYNEMLMNEIWFGGWVLYLDGNKEYIGSMYGGGSGSGCGCGCGSGCGSGSGTQLYSGEAICFGPHGQCTVRWDSGDFTIPSLYPQISVEPFNFYEKLAICWDRPYIAKITCTNYAHDYAEPPIYFTIPESYRN